MENKPKLKTTMENGKISNMGILFKLRFEIKFMSLERNLGFFFFSKYAIPTELHLSSCKYSCNNCLQVAEFVAR